MGGTQQPDERDRPQPLTQQRHGGLAEIVEAFAADQGEDAAGISPVVVEREVLAGRRKQRKQPSPQGRQRQQCPGQRRQPRATRQSTGEAMHSFARLASVG